MNTAERTIGDLKQKQSLPLEAKILLTKKRIQEWYDYWNGEVYVSISGGKDSTVLKHIIDSMHLDVPSVFVNTGLEYPEIQKFVFDIKSGKYSCFSSNVEITRPKIRFDEVLKKYGYPVISKEVSKLVNQARNAIERGEYNNWSIQKLSGTFLYKNGNKSIYNKEKYGYLIENAPFKISSTCCDVMKKKPAHEYQKQTGRKVILGTMADESMLRTEKWLKFGCNAFEQKGYPSSQPMSFWKDQDVLHYIKQRNVPYSSAYGNIVTATGKGQIDGQICMEEYSGCYDSSNLLTTTGCKRTGCIFCMYGCHLEKNPNRFQMLKETHPRQYDYCINGGEMVDGMWQPNSKGLGLGFVLDYLGIKY